MNRRNVLALALAAAASTRFARAAAPAKLKLGTIGSGNVGSNLGRAWAAAGHEVMFSSRDLAADQRLASEVGANARAGTPQQALAFGDVTLFAVPYGALPELGKTLAEGLRNRIIIDACNPFPGRDGQIADEARELGAGLMSARLLPGARIVRAFNAVGAARMGAMHLTPGQVGMPFASDDAEAVQIVSSLIRDVGFVPVQVGGLAMGKYLMPGTPLAGEHTPEEIRRIAATLKP